MACYVGWGYVGCTSRSSAAPAPSSRYRQTRHDRPDHDSLIYHAVVCAAYGGLPARRSLPLPPRGSFRSVPVRLPGPVPVRLPGQPLKKKNRKNSKNCSTDSRDQNKIPKKNSKKNFFFAKFVGALIRHFFSTFPDSSKTKSTKKIRHYHL